ncbi:MAG: hypothetical protein AAF703_17640 [Cyanobacteria bacterium P01_D01_bin.105]
MQPISSLVTVLTSGAPSQITSALLTKRKTGAYAARLAAKLLFSLGLLFLYPGLAQANSFEFGNLQKTLESHNFTVVLDLPPQPGNYGLFQPSTRTIWINPVVFDLEISVPTLVHEAVHAAQLCSSTDNNLAPLNLGLAPYARAYRLYTRYTGIRRTLEIEAYTIQARSDRVEYVTNLLNSRC